MSAVVDALDWWQDRLDWFVGPIGWLLPDRDEWLTRIAQGIFTATIVEIGVRTYGQRYLYGIRDVRGGERWLRPSTGKYETLKTSREVPRLKGDRAPIGRTGIVKTLGILSMSVAVPVALISNTLLVAYSIPPDVRDPATGLTSYQEYQLQTSMKWDTIYENYESHLGA